jgi:hypothetical protein
MEGDYGENKLIGKSDYVGRGGCVLGGGGGFIGKIKSNFLIGGWVEPQGGTIESLWGGNPASLQGDFNFLWDWGTLRRDSRNVR